jgi:hypothetical protein
MIDPKEICVLVSYNKTYAPLAEISVQDNIKKYCDLHGYQLFIDIHEEHIIEEKPLLWQTSYRKIKAASDILQNHNFKWLFYIDTDSLIMNKDIKLESFIDDNYSFMVLDHKMPAFDNPVTTIEGINNVIISHFFVKNNNDGLDILNAIWENKGWPENLPITEWDLEGRQIRILLNNPEYTNKIKAIDESTISHFWYVNDPFVVLNLPGINNNVWKPGDFIVHCVGYRTEERIQLLSDLNYFSGLQK